MPASSIDSSSSLDPQRQPDAAATGSSSSPAGGVGRDVSIDADPAVVQPLPHPILAKFRSMNARSRLSSSTAQNSSDGSLASTPRRGSLDQGGGLDSASGSAASSSRHGMPDPDGRAPIPPPGEPMDPCGSSGPASSVDSPSGGDGGAGVSVGEQPQGGFDSAAPALPRRMSRWASTGAVREPPSVTMMGGGGSGVQDNGTASSGALPAVGTVAASTNPLYCDILRSEISVDQLSIDISDSQMGE